MQPVRPFVIGVAGLAVSLYFRAAHRQLLRWKRTGDPRVRRWEDTGELGAWKIMLPASAVIALVGAIALIVDAIF